MSITTTEAELYCRLTLKQYGLPDFKIVWREKTKSFLGLALPWDKEIHLSMEVLTNFVTYNWTLKHEIAHCIQFKRMGNTFRGKNGRNDFHGKVFKEVCKEMGISSSRFIPVYV
jgi:hypothetical protein